MMMVKTGLDLLLADKFQAIAGKNVSLVCNQASIASDCRHAVDYFLAGHQEEIFRLVSLIGPQHGLWGHTQDNMIEWQSYCDKRVGVPVFSLYGKHRKPTAEMLDGINTLVIDLQDVGAKYYTFIWTMMLCMEACTARDIEVVVLDRPNPLNGVAVEGPCENTEFFSFVGLREMGIRHGLTIGEIAIHFKKTYYPNCRLTVVKMKNWQREMYFEGTGLPWAIPSPNMPSPDTAVVYPGMCLLEATNLSEGRGTTRPFELFGAEWMDGWQFSEALAKHKLPGIFFRPLEFEPTFHKHGKTVCGGCFMHITNRQTFKPFLTGVAIISEAYQLYPGEFAWKQPPYEYEYEKMPFDILVGNGWIREMIEAQASLKDLEAKWSREYTGFQNIRKDCMLYS